MITSAFERAPTSTSKPTTARALRRISFDASQLTTDAASGRFGVCICDCASSAPVVPAPNWLFDPGTRRLPRHADVPDVPSALRPSPRALVSPVGPRRYAPHSLAPRRSVASAVKHRSRLEGPSPRPCRDAAPIGSVPSRKVAQCCARICIRSFLQVKNREKAVRRGLGTATAPSDLRGQLSVRDPLSSQGDSPPST